MLSKLKEICGSVFREGQVRIYLICASLIFSNSALPAGPAIQFSFSLNEPVRLGKSIVTPGRYVVDVQENVGFCEMKLSSIADRNFDEENTYTVRGVCGVDFDGKLVKPKIELIELADGNALVVYFETPYKEQGRTFFSLFLLKYQQ